MAVGFFGKLLYKGGKKVLPKVINKYKKEKLKKLNKQAAGVIAGGTATAGAAGVAGNYLSKKMRKEK